MSYGLGFYPMEAHDSAILARLHRIGLFALQTALSGLHFGEFSKYRN